MDSNTPTGGPAQVAFGLTEEALDTLAQAVAKRMPASSTTGPRPWLDAEGAAKHLACPVSRIYSLSHRKHSTGFPVNKDGTRLIFRPEDLDDWVRSQQQ